MALAEFSLIQRYFARLGSSRGDVLLGVGDDAAQLQVPNDQTLVTAIDTLVSGVHFPEATPPADIGYKLLAVNLSDMAAMGAEPSWFTLALTLPRSDEAWLAPFAAGLSQLAEAHQLALVGGDTTQGPLVLSLQINGFVPVGQCLKRSGAQPGDRIYVTGTLGDAALGLQVAMKGLALTDGDYLVGRLNRPTPRVVVGLALRGIAHSAIDISDGLLADLGHITQQSGVAAQVQLQRLPLSSAYRAANPGYQPALTGGDDYELCFTAPPAAEDQIMAVADQCGCPISCIGEIVAGSGIRCFDGEIPATVATGGYQHFSADT